MLKIIQKSLDKEIDHLHIVIDIKYDFLCLFKDDL